ncbi:hypothetical protein CVT25_009286 [Psilocybe cyanescens]|uniref:Uncharacterized protein n=1 Tax=Psilocybe cyanescens TaxID=93625 RepID=A0A409WWC2_PSICY|nr:hypothetical protein CVT25_009286 [Psilocybe cyanescens]
MHDFRAVPIAPVNLCATLVVPVLTRGICTLSSLNLAIDYRTPSPAPSISLAHGSVSPPHGPCPTLLLRLKTDINPSLFLNELEYLYTGKDCGKGFEILFDSDVRERSPGGLITRSSLRHPAVIPLPFALNAARRSPGAHYSEDDTRAVPRYTALTPKLRDSLLYGLGLAKRTTPRNAFAKLWAAEHALRKIGRMIEPWGDVVRETLRQRQAGVDEVLARESDGCLGAVGDGNEKGDDGERGDCEGDCEGAEWMEIMRSGKVRFEDGERVEWAMAAMLKG